MKRKEWREVGKQSLYFVMALAAMALLLGGVDLLLGTLGAAQARPLDGEKLVVILGIWMLMFSMFLGLSPFAMDSKQKGMEYLLTLPIPRRRLLAIKFLPRLAAVVLFYLAYVLLYAAMGDAAFAGGFVLFSLAYFALFLISFSLSLVHENFIVQSVWAGFALAGYLALCLYLVLLGFSWKFRVPAAWVGSGIWHDLSYDGPTLLVSIAVFLLMTAPFLVSFFLAFKKFDLKPARAFNRRHLKLFLPLLLAAFGISLGLSYFVQSRSGYRDSQFFVLKDQRLLAAGFPGKLDVYGGNGRRRVDTGTAAFWDWRPLLAKGDRLYLSGYDTGDGSKFIGSLDLADLSWRELHRFPYGYVVSLDSQEIYYDGECFVYLKRSQAEAGPPGIDSTRIVRPDALELVRVDPASGGSRTIGFRSPLFRKYNGPRIIGSDESNGLRFWVIAQQGRNVLRLWEDGRVGDLGPSRGMPACVNALLFSRGDNSLLVRRLLGTNADSEVVEEIVGRFDASNQSYFFSMESRLAEIYAVRDKRIVRIGLSDLAVQDVASAHGAIWMVESGDFYYVEFQSWPGLGTDKWKRLYRLRDGKMVFLKQFDFGDAGYGNLHVGPFGVILYQTRMKNKTEASTSVRFFALPDLKELKFEGLK